MKVQQQIQHVVSWGFKDHGDGYYVRNAPQGFREWWSTTCPDVISFYTETSDWSHDYVIDWSLFN